MLKEILPNDHALLTPTHLLPNYQSLETSLIDNLFSSTKAMSLNESAPLYKTERNKPVAILMAGGTGAGKSTVLGQLKEAMMIPDRNYLKINANDFKEQMPQYQELVKLKDRRAAEVVHEASSMIAKKCVNRAIEEELSFSYKQDLYYDGTLSNKKEAISLVERLKTAGYEVIVVGVTIEPEVSYARAETRSEDSGRWVPKEVMEKNHKGFTLAFEDIANPQILP